MLDYSSFITPIFLHAGIIHLALNMFAQLTLSAQVSLMATHLYGLMTLLKIEREMGSSGFLVTYCAAGVFGCESCVWRSPMFLMRMK